MSQWVARFGMFRSALVLVGVTLIICEVGAVVVEPAVALSISLPRTYAVLSLGGVVAIAILGAAIALVPIGIALHATKPPFWQHSSHRRMLWARANGTAAMIGAVLGVFLIGDAVTSFGYLGLEDAYPDFAFGRFWLTDANFLLSSSLLGLATLSSVGFLASSRFSARHT